MPDKTYAKVVLNGTTYVDLTSDTVDPSTLLAGYTAHDRSGALITGTFDSSIFVLKAGDTMTGPLILSGAPTENLHAATKKYVDDSVAKYLPLTGGVMGGVVDDPEDENHSYIYTNTILPDYITLNKDEYYSHTLVGNSYSGINPGNITLSKLYTDTSIGYVRNLILKDSEISFENGPYGGSITKYASYKSNGISYTTYNYVFPSKSGTFALTNDLLSYIPKTGGTITGGYLIIDDTHLTSGSSSAYLTLGNNVDSSSEGSSFGALHLYGTGVYKSSIRTTTLTDNRQLYLPDKDGTLAVTDDLNSYVLKTGDSLTGALSFYDGSTLKSKISNTELQINGHDLIQITPFFSQVFSTSIAANADLNTASFLDCKMYYTSSNATAQSLSNCPTVYAFNMKVENAVRTEVNYSDNPTVYRIRTVTDILGKQYVQYVIKEGSQSTPTYGSWDYVAPIRMLGGGNLNTMTNLGDSGLYEARNQNIGAWRNWTGLINVAGSGAHQMQFSADGVAVRSYTGSPSAWTSWNKVITSADVPDVTASYGNITTSTTLSYTGKYITIPTAGWYAVTAYANFVNSTPIALSIVELSDNYYYERAYAERHTGYDKTNNYLWASCVGNFTANHQLRLWAKYSGASANGVYIAAHKLP